MAEPIILDYKIRKNFGKITPVIEMPHLLDVQLRSFENFLQAYVLPEERKDFGLQAVFKSVFPIKDPSGKVVLEFLKYIVDKPPLTPEECIVKGETYSSPIRILIRLVLYDIDPLTKNQAIRDIKEQEVFFGDVPIMTETGSFIINGVERVIVNQMHRSPGVFFQKEKGQSSLTGKPFYSARIIPNRGSWLDFVFDSKDLLYVRIDRKKKIPVTILLKALGQSKHDILNYFYTSEKIDISHDPPLRPVIDEILEGEKLNRDLVDTKTGEVIIRRDRKITRGMLKRLKLLNIKEIPITYEELAMRVSSHDIKHPKTLDIIIKCNENITEEKVKQLRSAGIKSIEILHIDLASIKDTLDSEKFETTEDAQKEIYKRMKPNEPPTLDFAKEFLAQMFFKPERYDLSPVGRLKINHRLGLNVPLSVTTLTPEDIITTIKELIHIRETAGKEDDIDHLGNRRIKTVGELLENVMRIGLVHLERAIKEKLTIEPDVEMLMPLDIINSKPVIAILRQFFGSSPLSQFMDQTNPLSELTHKRRLSALGPGGLTRERAGFEARDVHSTHYGRICPVETPEGQNIGLIVSMTSYARINDYGFIETPYRKVKNNKVTDEVVFLSALEERGHTIAQANAPLDKNGTLNADLISVRKDGEFALVSKEEVDLMDVSPAQVMSVAAALIPFLEHDDANRVLMGANMQRQAVPLIHSEAPLVGTGLEFRCAKDSGSVVTARKSGIVESVDATRIVIKVDEKEIKKGEPALDIYNLIKFRRSNQNSCINQRPLIKKGSKIRKGQIIADGFATHLGELALGRNVLVAFMPWGGYNFEDSILLSERVVKEDVFTSIHIEEFECVIRDTKLGKEEVTRDIPGLSESILKNLDENGIIRIGAEIEPGDILVGKVTPKGEGYLSPEEKLLRAIFGEKAKDVRDTSLRVPPGISGVVIDVKILSRKGIEQDPRKQDIEAKEIERVTRDMNEEIEIIKENARNKLQKLIVGKKSNVKLSDGKKVILKQGEAITEEHINKISVEKWRNITITDSDVERRLEELIEKFSEQTELIKIVFEDRISKVKKADELPHGVLKIIKVYVAIKRKVSVGDKMAGRHGNKGVVARILPEEDMPYLEDGTPVDVVLNPLGVPSRMNVGQILETHLGWAAKVIGEQIYNMNVNGAGLKEARKRLKEIYKSHRVDSIIDDMSDDDLREFLKRLKNGLPIATPVFDGATEAEIEELQKVAGLPVTGQVTLYDGRTGEQFHNRVTVGVMYMMKLHHLVDEKIHARSTGPSGLITQQPLGGKAQFGGQRLGEMEVWALEAYGAANTLQEFLTVKSDDVNGRTRLYESIIKGRHEFQPGHPESFKVLIKELQSLALDIQFDESQKD